MNKYLLTAVAGLISVSLVSSVSAAPEQKRPNRKPATQQQDGAKKQRGAVIFQKIEAKLGKELTEDQKQQILAVMQTSRAKLQESNQKFISDVAAALKMSVEDLRSIIGPEAREPGAERKPGNMRQKIEEALKRQLTEEELAAIKAAAAARREAAMPVRKEMLESIAGITGLSAADLQEIMPGAAGGQPQDKPAKRAKKGDA